MGTVMDPLHVTLDDFEEFDIEKPPLIYPGVYVFSLGKKIVYIGESGDIPRRLREHRRKKWHSEALKVRTYFCADPETRLIIETAMIFRERPLENRAIKIGISRAGKLFPLNFLRASSK